MIKALSRHFLLIIAVPILLVGCVADKGASKSASCGSGQQFDPVSRKCVVAQGATAPANLPPVATTVTATISEDSLGSAIPLNYTDVDGDLATACTIVGYDITTFSVAPTCSCAGGFCYAVVIPDANVSRLTSFTYTVSDPNDGPSLAKTVAVSMVNVNDLPTFATTTDSYTGNEDLTIPVGTLPAATDIDCDPSLNDLPNANCPGTLSYSIVSYSRTPAWGVTPTLLGNILRNCMGANGSALNDLDCDLVPEANFNGSYDFTYRANDGWGNSTNTVAVTVTVNPVNDVPIAACSSCSITFPEDGSAVVPQTPGAQAPITFLLKDEVNYTYMDIEDTAGATVTDSDDYATCILDNTGVTLGTVTLNDATTCELIWTPGAVDTNGSAGSFTIQFVDLDGAPSNAVTVSLTIEAKNDLPTIAVTTGDVTYPNGALVESPTAFVQGANNYPYAFDVAPAQTVDPAPATPTEVLTYTLDTVDWNFNGGADTGVGVLPGDASVPFNISGCMGGTSTLSCLLTIKGDDGNKYGTLTGYFTVSDPDGATATDSFSVSIAAAADAPIACQYSRYIDAPECGLSGCTGTTSPLAAGLTPASHTASKPLFWYESNTATCWRSTGTTSTDWTPNGQNEQQRLNFTGVPTAGTFVIDFDGQSTAAINFDDTALEVEAALEALVNLSNVTVTGSIGSSLFITFGGNVALSNVPQVTISSNSLGVSVVPSTVIEGGSSIISNKSINEKDILYIRRLIIDEGGNSFEDAFDIEIRNLTSSNSILIKPENVLFSRDGSEPAVTDRADLANVYAWNTGVTSGDASAGLMKIIPTGTTAGSSVISFDIVTIDTGVDQQTTTVSFTVTVNPVSIQHNDWKIITAAGPTVNKYGEVKSVSNVCSFSRDQCNGAACTGTAAPTVPANGGSVGAIYWATGTSQCYHHDGTDWYPFTSVCPVTASAFEANCSGASCIGNAAPAQAAGLGHFYYDMDDDTCYVSVETDGGGDDFVTFTAPGSATIAWENFTLSGTGTISGYWVYRRVAGEEYDYDFPLNKTIIPLGTTQYIDNATNSWEPPAPNTAYYYEVRPVVNSIPTKPVEAYAQARLIVPNDNTAFMNRRIANKLMCAKLFSPSDKTNNNRCVYVGPGDSNPQANNSAYYDIGTDLIVDRFEAGCAYTQGTCNTTDGNCVSNLSPNGNITAAVNSIYYNRSDGRCYITADGTTWTDYATNNNPANFLSGYSNTELPPLVFINQTQSAAFCTAAGAQPSIVGLSAAPVRSLPNRKQQMAYTQWDTQSKTDTNISSLETGLSLNTTAKCNSSSASGLTGYSDTETPDSSSSYSLPGTSSSGIRSVATGASVTTGCQSFAGVQDAIGNVAEWVQETMSCTGVECAGVGATFNTSVAGSVLTSGTATYGVYIGADVAGTLRWDSVPDGADSLTPIGPCNDTDADDLCDGALGAWDIENRFNDAGRFFIPMGLPVHRDFDDNTGDPINTAIYPSDHPLAGTQVGTVTSWAKVIGQTSGITSNQLHADSVDYNIANVAGTTAAFVVGGGFTDGAGSGLYRFELQPQTQTAVDIGFRCVAPVAGTYSP